MRNKNLAIMAALCVVYIQSAWAMDPRDEDKIQSTSGSLPMILHNVTKDEEPIISTEIEAPSPEANVLPLTEQKPQPTPTGSVKREPKTPHLNLETVKQHTCGELNTRQASPTLLSPKESPKSGRERRPSTPKTLPVRPRVGSASRVVKSSPPHSGRERKTSDPQARKFVTSLVETTDNPPPSSWSGRAISPRQVGASDKEVSSRKQFRSSSNSPKDSSSEEILEWGNFERKKRDMAPPRSRSQSESQEDSLEDSIGLGEGRDPSPRRSRKFLPELQLLRDLEKMESNTPTTRKVSFSPEDQDELRNLLREIEENKILREIEKKK